jgi:carbon storage regulator
MMLVLSRKIGESIIINDTIRVTVLAVRANQIRLGFSAPPAVSIIREELLQVTAPVLTSAPSAPVRQVQVQR